MAEKENMKVLMLSEDPNIFIDGSGVKERMKCYAALFDKLVVAAPVSDTACRSQTLGNLTLLPVRSRFAILGRVRVWKMLSALCSCERFDVISVQSPNEIGLIGFLLAKKYKSRFQLQIHTDIFNKAQIASSWKALLRSFIARFLIPRADRIRVASQRIADSLESNIKCQMSNVVTLPIFVDRRQIADAVPAFDLHDKYPEFDFIILMVSRLTAEKNIGMAFDALKELTREFPGCGLVIVGDGPERENLQLTTNDLQLTNNVRFEGWQNDLIPYYKGADLYLLTSDFEGYGRTVVEAAAAGLPVIMTDVGVAGELIRDGETGRTVKIKDAEGFLRALLWARENWLQMKEMAQRAKEVVLEMKPKTTKEYVEMYRESFL